MNCTFEGNTAFNRLKYSTENIDDSSITTVRIDGGNGLYSLRFGVNCIEFFSSPVTSSMIVKYSGSYSMSA